MMLNITSSFDHAINHSQERYRKVVDEANEIIYRISPTGHFTFVNPTAAAIVRRTVAECLGLHFLALIREDHRDAALAFYLTQIKERMASTYYEFPAIAKDDTEVWIGQNVQLLIEEGEVVELQALGRDITAQKAVEEHLFDSEQRYRLLFNANPHPTWVYDTTTLQFLAVNQAAIAHYGYSSEEFLNLTIKDIRSESEHERLLYSLSETGRLIGTWKHLKKDRTLIDVEIAAHPIIFDGKQAEIVTATDVTERLRGETEREVIQEVISSVSVTSNLEELLQLVHRSLQKVLYAENCFIALHDPVTELVHFEFWVDKFDRLPAPRPSNIGFTGHVLRTGEPLLLTHETKTQMYDSGEVKRSGTSSASWLGVPLLTPSRIIGVLVVQHYEEENVYTDHHRDFLVSVAGQIALAIERKRAQQALLEANNRAVTEYERLLETLTTLAESFGAARDVVTICKAFYSFAVASVPCSGMFVSLFDAESNQRKAIYACSEGVEIDVSTLPPMTNSNSPHSRAVKTGEVVIEDDFQTAIANEPVVNVGLERDSRLPQSSLVVPMILEGCVVGAVEVQSVTRAAFKKEHVTAIRMAANLAAKTIENVRLLELEREREAQLRQAQKMEAIGQLAGGVAHDFNNLLTVISGYSDLTLRELGDSPVRTCVEEIKRAGMRAASLTRQLLAFSRRQILQPKVMSLNTTISDMDKMLRRLIGENLDLVTMLQPDLGKIKADPGQMEQVFMNLVVNARDALPDGGEITIETKNVFLTAEYAKKHAMVTPGPYVLLTVSDNGIGMDHATQQRIFDPFFTTKALGKGTGLGLSTVYGIVKQSGGSIQVNSEFGVGTTFKVYLPRVDEPVTSELQSDASGMETGTETILLVEDEEIVRTMTRHILELSGHKVLEAACGSEAIQVLNDYEGPVDLVLTDVVMPQMSGPTLVKEVLRLRPNIKSLYMSGYTDNAILLKGILDEGLPFLQKPFTPLALTQKIRQVLNVSSV